MQNRLGTPVYTETSEVLQIGWYWKISFKWLYQLVLKISRNNWIPYITSIYIYSKNMKFLEEKSVHTRQVQCHTNPWYATALRPWIWKLEWIMTLFQSHVVWGTGLIMSQFFNSWSLIWVQCQRKRNVIDFFFLFIRNWTDSTNKMRVAHQLSKISTTLCFY